MDAKTVQNRPISKPGESAVHLTQATVAALPAASPEQGSRLYLDDEIPGFCCQVTYTGTKTFRLRYRKTINGATKWFSVKIGRWRAGAEAKAHAETAAERGKRGITAGQARRIAAQLRADVDRGENPALEAKLRAAEQQKAAAGAITVAAAYRLYHEAVSARRSPMKPSSREKLENSFEKHILPRLGARMMSSLSPDDVRLLAREISKPRIVRGRKVGGPSASNHVIVYLRAFLNWAKKREIVTENVVNRVELGEVLSPENKRERYLTREEWAAVMHELDEWPHWVRRGARNRETVTMRLDEPQLRQLVSCEALRVALLTGSRKGEIFKMRWTDVDLDKGWWIKPAETTKSSRTHEIALPKLAVESLRKLQAAHGDPVFVFPGKHRLDKIVSGRKPRGEEGGPVEDVHELWCRIREKLGIPDVRIHDLRHTAASVLISNGATLFDVGAQLGHSQAQTTQRYAHLLEERKRHIAGLMDAFADENPKQPLTGGSKPAKRPSRVRSTRDRPSTTV